MAHWPLVVLKMDLINLLWILPVSVAAASVPAEMSKNQLQGRVMSVSQTRSAEST